MIKTNVHPNELNTLSKLLDKYYPLSPKDKALLFNKLVRIEKKKGEFLYKNEDRGAAIFFLVKGAIKVFNVNGDGLEEVYWFGFDGDICFCPQNYVRNTSYNENTMLYEDAVLYRVDVAYLKTLYSAYREWANWGRCMAEDLVVVLSEMADRQKFQKAKVRYDILLQAFPEITQRVPLKDIASYLGITPVSLSRIRAAL